jgi:hypothetical protein
MRSITLAGGTISMHVCDKSQKLRLKPVPRHILPVPDSTRATDLGRMTPLQGGMSRVSPVLSGASAASLRLREALSP